MQLFHGIYSATSDSVWKNQRRSYSLTRAAYYTFYRNRLKINNTIIVCEKFL